MFIGKHRSIIDSIEPSDTTVPNITYIFYKRILKELVINRYHQFLEQRSFKHT